MVSMKRFTDLFEWDAKYPYWIARQKTVEGKAVDEWYFEKSVKTKAEAERYCRNYPNCRIVKPEFYLF